MHFYVKLIYDNDLVEKIWYNDLKTIKGVKKRLQKHYLLSYVKSYIIEACKSDNYYNENNWRVVETYDKYQSGGWITMTTMLSKKEAK